MVNLQLIQVPGGCTSILQPLDVEFNGPMLKARQRIWREKKLLRPFDKDTPQAAVESVNGVAVCCVVACEGVQR